LDRADRIEQVVGRSSRPVDVLLLVRGEKGIRVGALDSHEHHVESGRAHRLEQLRHLSEVHARLGEQRKRIPSLPLPFPQTGKESKRVTLVADEVVVHEEQRASPAQVVEQLELAQHLLRVLRPRDPSVELGDVAELAVERAAPRELKRHRVVTAESEEVVAGKRSLRDGRLGELGIDVTSRAAGDVGQEAVKRVLHLAQQEVIHPATRFLADLVVERGRVRAAGDDRYARPVAAADHLVERISLDDHGRREDHVRPGEVHVGQRLDVEVDDLQLVIP
jgi:hypothetical protein